MNTNPSAKRILCFGDSNTWGYIPNGDEKSTYRRYSSEIRYTGQLQNLLRLDFEIIEDGVNSRTIKYEDKRPGKQSRVAYEYFKQCFFAHDPVDIITLALGTNELKTQFNLNVQEILEAYIEFIKMALDLKSQINSQSPKYIVILPPYINDSTVYANERYKDGLKRSTEFRELLKKYLSENSIEFIDCFTVEDVGADGIHLTSAGHNKLALGLSKVIKNYYAN